MDADLTRLAFEGDLEGVRAKLDEGAPVDFVQEGGPDATPPQVAAAAGPNATPLQVAGAAGHLEVVRLLLERGADVNRVGEKGFTPVISAARASQWQVVKLLAEHGADFRHADQTRRNAHDYLRRCRGQRTRMKIQAILESRTVKPPPPADLGTN